MQQGLRLSKTTSRNMPKLCLFRQVRITFLRLSENVSDQGAGKCVTEVASRLENPDYQKLYRSMANAWASTKTREYAQYAAASDVHSEDKLRVNRVVVNCDEFYKTFGIS